MLNNTMKDRTMKGSSLIELMGLGKSENWIDHLI